MTRREEAKKRTQTCAAAGCEAALTQPRVWLCDSCEEKRLDKIEQIEKREGGREPQRRKP